MIKLFCECNQSTCKDELKIDRQAALAAYNCYGYIIIPEHFDKETDEIMEKSQAYWIIKKKSDAKTNPDIPI